MVTVAEVAAAHRASPVIEVTDRLARVESFAVLTSNSADAVSQFVSRFPPLRQRLSLVVGREGLGGPKTDFERFRSGMERCLDVTAVARAGTPPVYVGDTQYELEFAYRLGLTVVDVSQIPPLDAISTPKGPVVT